MRDLVEQAQRGDREAFAALVHSTSDRMYAIAVRILRDPDLAEDALQGALVAVWRQTGRTSSSNAKRTPVESSYMWLDRTAAGSPRSRLSRSSSGGE